MRTEYRKQYAREWAKSPAGKESKRKSARKYKESQRGKLMTKQYHAKYKKTENGKRLARKYRQTKSAKESHAKSNQKQYQTHAEQLKARSAVNYAVKTGKLPHISTQNCKKCGNTAKHYHHNRYDKSHYLDVTPLCDRCHKEYHLAISSH